MDIQNWTEVVVHKSLEHVLGKESKAWEKWWDRASKDIEGVGIALYGALLSLGAPPAAEHLTADLTTIALDSIVDIRINKRKHRRQLAEMDRRYRKQMPYNAALNEYARKHGYVYFHRNHDPAQFRKLFAGFLHACKEVDDERNRL